MKFIQEYGDHLGPRINLELCPDPLVHFKRNCPRDRAGQTLIYPIALALGLKHPLDPFIQEVCRQLGKPPGAINTNGLKVVWASLLSTRLEVANFPTKNFSMCIPSDEAPTLITSSRKVAV